jgi:hypothetical protein
MRREGGKREIRADTRRGKEEGGYEGRDGELHASKRCLGRALGTAPCPVLEASCWEHDPCYLYLDAMITRMDIL